MAGCLIVFNGETLFSGTPLFDEWVIAVLNFVCGFPILLLGMFDRCLEKDYIRKNPIVFQPTRQNELITLRVLIRWVIMTFAHIFVLYYGTIPQLSLGGGMSSAFFGLMRDTDQDLPGDGEGGDLQSVGTVTFTCMIILLAYKVSLSSPISLHSCRFLLVSDLLVSLGTIRIEVARSWSVASVHLSQRRKGRGLEPIGVHLDRDHLGLYLFLLLFPLHV
jgi:magnesium-transporting ATPase (P-type)